MSEPAFTLVANSTLARHFPLFYGTKVNPSKYLSSAVISLFDSLVYGIFAQESDHQTKSLICAWCDLRLSTKVPREHEWRSHVSSRLSPTAIVIVSSSSLRPHADVGSTKSQSLLCGALTVSSLDLSCPSLQLSTSIVTVPSMVALSYGHCLCARGMSAW